MHRLRQLILLCYVCFIVFIIIDMGNADVTSRTRQKRYLIFRNTSKFFWRLNFKANMVPWNQIFAQALGFRMNWDEPPETFRPYHRLHRRTVYSNLELLLDKNGLNGYHCVRRAICEMVPVTTPKGIYFKILKIVFRRQSSDTERWHKNITEEDCATSINSCPFSFLEVSTYTDI
ncbi:unnamed protein product [Diatraea saccharalis]|uniref:Uncharacterized protein n=1 Tax=Diatraea saccharalis TaxID=40085 RepID=A0A9N9R7V3_9NEOP|nr:unnamed protein product [Diatraea saccharalis]